MGEVSEQWEGFRIHGWALGAVGVACLLPAPPVHPAGAAVWAGGPLTGPALAFVAALGASGREEVELQLQGRVAFSKAAVSRLVASADTAHRRLQELCQRIQACGETPCLDTGVPWGGGLGSLGVWVPWDLGVQTLGSYGSGQAENLDSWVFWSRMGWKSRLMGSLGGVGSGGQDMGKLGARTPGFSEPPLLSLLRGVGAAR